MPTTTKRRKLAKRSAKYHRLNLTIREDQYRRIVGEGINLSGLIRDLLDDRYSSTKIVLSISSEARRLYDLLVSNFGITDLDLEPYFLEALNDVLAHRSEQMQSLKKEIKEQFEQTKHKKS